MEKSRALAFTAALIMIFTMVICPAANAQMSFAKPISTSVVKPDVNLSDFSGLMLIDIKGDSLLHGTGSADTKIPACGSVVTLMLAYAAATNLSYDAVVTCEGVSELSGIGLKDGTMITVEDLIAAVILEKAEDARAALSTFLKEASGKDMTAFMNEAATALEMNSTYYANETGEYDPSSCTSLRDLAILSDAVCTHPMLADLFETTSLRIKSVDGNFSTTLRAQTSLDLSSDTNAYILGDGQSEAGSAMSILAVSEGRPVLIVLSIAAGDTIRYSVAAEQLIYFAFKEYSLIDFAPIAETLLPNKMVVVSDIEVMGYKFVSEEKIEMNEAVTRSVASTILSNPSAFTLKEGKSEVVGDTVTTEFTLVYLNTNSIASFTAEAEAPKELEELFATPTPKSTSTGYEDVVSSAEHTSMPVADEEEEEQNFRWIIYIAISVAVAALIIVAAEKIRSSMEKY